MYLIHDNGSTLLLPKQAIISLHIEKFLQQELEYRLHAANDDIDNVIKFPSVRHSSLSNVSA